MMKVAKKDKRGGRSDGMPSSAKQYAGRFIVLLLMLILPLKDGLSWAAEQDTEPLVSEAQDKPQDENEVNVDEALSGHQSSRFLDKIKAEINVSQDELTFVNRQIAETEGKLNDVQGKITTLKDQIDNLDRQIAASLKLIDDLTVKIDQKHSEIATLEYEMEQKTVEISYQKKLMAEYLTVLFKDRGDLTSVDELNQDGLNTWKLLMGAESTAEKLRAMRYSEVLEEQGRLILERLKALLEEQESQQKILEVKKDTLTLMYEKVTAEKRDLDAKKGAKENLLRETKGQEEIYQKLLAQSKANQEDVLLEIETLRKNLAFVQERIKKLKDNFNPDDYAKLLKVRSNSRLLDYLIAGDGSAEFSPIWPVNPARGVSAHFREASYVQVFGMQHNAIDIRAYQGTPIRAAAGGIVYRAQDNGYGYSFIILAHANGYMTLYGHVSEIMVSEGQEVQPGEVIGLSGATPGTKGAGLYTTGPHLHFEVLKNGVNVDPLEYLNLAYLQMEALPEKYLNKALGDRQKIRRMPEKAKVRRVIEN